MEQRRRSSNLSTSSAASASSPVEPHNRNTRAKYCSSHQHPNTTNTRNASWPSSSAITTIVRTKCPTDVTCAKAASFTTTRPNNHFRAPTWFKGRIIPYILLLLGLCSFFLHLRLVHDVDWNTLVGSSSSFDLNALVGLQKNSAVVQLPICQVKGVVINNDGRRIAGADITVEEDLLLENTNQLKQVTKTSKYGQFIVSIEPKPTLSQNLLLVVSADGHRTEMIYTVLSTEYNRHGILNLDPIILPYHNPNAVRMLFGGDVTFGRKWIDPHLSTPSAKSEIPKDDPRALVLPSDPEPGTKRALRSIRPWFQEADFCSINLETPVLSDPRTPNKKKIITFFTLPGSLSAIKWLGVDYVALGNNHVYDYLRHGLKETLRNLEELEIAYSGAGLNITHAAVPYRTKLSDRETKFSFLSLTNVENKIGKVGEYATVATTKKGGAADLRVKEALSGAIDNDYSEGYTPIPQLHVGVEYSTKPSSTTQAYMKKATDLGVPLVVMHHPHVVHGIGVYNYTKGYGGFGRKTLKKRTVHLMSLGNLVMDGSYLESMLSIVARVDMEEGGTQVDKVRILPIYMENYAPKPIGGFLASRFLRYVSESSHDYGGHLYPYNGMGYLDLGKGHDESVRRTRRVKIDVVVNQGSTVVDLRKWLQMDESLLSWSSMSSSLPMNNQVQVKSGRDIFGFGDFEDYIIDTFEQRATGDAMKARWDLGEHGEPCKEHDVYRGSVSMCSTISPSSNTTSSEIVNNDRIRVLGALGWHPQKDLTLMGYAMGNESGIVTVKAKYYTGTITSTKTFGEEVAFEHQGGNFSWTTFATDLNMPADTVKEGDGTGKSPAASNARALQISVEHSVPESIPHHDGERKMDAIAAFDDIAVISWDSGNLGDGELLQVPHARDFLNVYGNPGTYQLELTFARYIPTVASKV